MATPTQPPTSEALQALPTASGGDDAQTRAESEDSNQIIPDASLTPPDISIYGNISEMDPATLASSLTAVRDAFFNVRKRLRREELHNREHVRARHEMERMLLQSGTVLPMPKRGVILDFCLPRNWQTAPSATSFKDNATGFPHRVQDTKKGDRELIVEKRIHVHLKCRLHTIKEAPRTEYDLDPSGSVQFQLSIHFAGTNAPVQLSDLHNPPETLYSCSDSALVARMAGGMVTFPQFKLKFTSDQTMPKQQLFVFRVAPVDAHLRSDPDLVATTPPFRVTARSLPTTR